MRRLFRLAPAPEFAAWLEGRGISPLGERPLEDADGARSRLLRQLDSLIPAPGGARA